MTRKSIIPVIFAPLLWLVSCGGQSSREEEATKPIVTVKVAHAQLKTFDVMVKATATIFPRQQATIASRLTAPIRALNARKGDSVTANQVLAELDNRDSAAQVDDAKAQLADAEANLQKLQSATVPAEIDRARGQVQVAEAALNLAQKNFDRRSQLFEQGAIPNRDLLQAETDLAQARTTVEVARRSLDLLQNQSSTRDVRIAQTRVDSAQAKLLLAQTQLQFTQVRAPFAGTLTEQSMYTGDMASPTGPIFQIMDLSVVIARAQVPEFSASSVRAGQHCTFVPADSPARSFSGHITVLNRAVDPQRRTIETWCEIPNGEHVLQGNVFGDVTITTGELANAVVTSLAAVQFKEGTRTGSVLVVDSQMLAHSREIEAGQSVGDMVPIIKGLQAGETVIVEGGYGLPDGTHVQPTAAQVPDSGKGQQ